MLNDLLERSVLLCVVFASGSSHLDFATLVNGFAGMPSVEGQKKKIAQELR